MQSKDYCNHKIQSITTLLPVLQKQRFLQRKIVFTNGCFDILHAGHIQSLNQAAALGHFLVVGLNADGSVKKLKGAGRPVNDEKSRALVLANLMMTDAIVIFEEDTPLELIKSIKPDILVKGGDYSIEQIAGSKEVLTYGGKVEILPILPGYSTTGILQQLKKS